MKATHSNRRFVGFTTSSGRPLLGRMVFPVGALAMLLAQPAALGGNTWDGGAGTGNWGDANNWSPDGAPVYGTLTFSGTTQTTTNNNSVTAMNQVNWNGTAAWVLNGSVTLNLFDFGGAPAKLESFGSGGVTINANITFAANNGSPPNPFGEINAVGSDIVFNAGTLAVNGTSVNGIKFFGGNGRDVSFANTVNAGGKWFGFTGASTQSVTIATGANVTTGDFYVMNSGTLRLAGGTLTTSAVRLGGDFGNTGNQNQTLGGTLELTPLTGGVSFGGTINTVTGNTSNALRIDSRNTSGTNNLTGGIFLDSDLEIRQAAGGSLATATGTFDIKARKLVVDSSGTVTIGQALASSLGAGGWLVKQGTGTLVLGAASNSYTGTNSNTLNANGTQIAAGILAIAADTSLGIAPAGAYDNIRFTGSGTLRGDATISLHANRNISVATGATATFDTNGNSMTINGIISGSNGSLRKTGSGTLTLAGNNTYTGSTRISGGTLVLDRNGGALADTGAVILDDVAGAGLLLQRSETIGSLEGGGSSGGNIDLDGHTLTVASGAAVDTIFSGQITGKANSTMIKTGAGKLTLANTNNPYGGNTHILGGTLSISNYFSIGSKGGKTVFLDNNGTLETTADITYITRIFDVGANGGRLRQAAGTTLVIGSDPAGVLQGTGTLTKLGAGALVLANLNNTHTGSINVNEGTLRVNGSTTASSAITVASGATIGGAGSILGTLAVSGNLAPGGPGVDIQTLSAGTTTWNGGSNLWQFDLGATSGSSDVLAITGDFNQGTAGDYKFDFMGSVPASFGNIYTLVTWTVGTTFSNASQFSFQNLGGGFSGEFTLNANSLTFTVVPEPTGALACLLVAGGLMRRRRK